MTKKPVTAGFAGDPSRDGVVVGGVNRITSIPIVPPDADSAEWLRVTLSSIGDGVITADGSGRVTFLNPMAQNLTGWTQEQAAGRELEEVFRIVNEETRAKVENPALRALRDGVIVGLANHTLLIARDGTERPIDDSAAPIRNTGGDTHGVVLVFRDITERRATERALHDSEVRYRRLFQTAKDGILILDARTGKIIDANAFMSALVGVEPQDLLGKELHEIGMFADAEQNKSAFRELQQAGYLRHEHLPVQNRRGDRVEVEFIANVYHEGETLVAQCNVRDISQRVEMTAQIERQAVELAEQARRKDEFLAMLSHELRNPLAPIRSAVHLLKLHGKGGENPIQRQAREIIERQVGNLTRLVSDLLEVSRFVSGRIRLDLQTVDLNQVVLHAVESVKPLVEQHRHTLSVNLSDEMVWVNADVGRLEEVVINLLNNAAKYTPDGGEIEVTCEYPRGENCAKVSVRDNGVGIESALLPRIFDLFTQAERSLDRSQGGLGIGLSLAHRLVALQGGTIEAHSPPAGSDAGSARGSEFIVKLPPAPVPHPMQATPPSCEPTEMHEGGRVLVVDDNVDLATMLGATLRHMGYSVQVTHTGPEGLKAAQHWRPDIVVLDIGLPGLDGYEVARRLRADRATARMRLIALTGYGRDSDLALAREAGFDGHLIKPVDFDELEKMMATPHGKVEPA